MKNINDILTVYTQGFASLEQTNEDLKAADAGFHLDPGKNELTPEEIAETRTCPVVEGWGLLDSGTGSLDKVQVLGGELLHGMGDAFALLFIGGNRYKVHDTSLEEYPSI